MVDADYIYRAMGAAMLRILAVAGMMAIFAAVIIWIVAIVKWDGNYTCDESDCDTCPFPCDKHTEGRE